ncbi:MAG: mechanosensitive ion channel [Oscillatoriales cyanobacterium SM2_1_8]|nr:mechanosensitive ion channel [Oscillatoriales cyanobacterium SM2_1_8]
MGGVALALASRSVFEDLFNYYTIVLDRPFEIGDFLVVDESEFMGTVERVGIKSTRLRSLGGRRTDLCQHLPHHPPPAQLPANVPAAGLLSLWRRIRHPSRCAEHRSRVGASPRRADDRHPVRALPFLSVWALQPRL